MERAGIDIGGKEKHKPRLVVESIDERKGSIHDQAHLGRDKTVSEIILLARYLHWCLCCASAGPQEWGAQAHPRTQVGFYMGVDVCWCMCTFLRTYIHRWRLETNASASSRRHMPLSIQFLSEVKHGLKLEWILLAGKGHKYIMTIMDYYTKWAEAAENSSSCRCFIFRKFV